MALALIVLIGVSMSLHDIDKTNSNRITPILNSADDVSQRMAQGTNGVQNTNDLDEVDGLQFRERQIVAVQDGENKAALGFYGAANKFGLKVADDGVDVLTATDDQLVFNSEQNTFKIVGSGTVTVGSFTVTFAGNDWKTGSATTVTIPHGLSYVPAIKAYINNASSYYPIPLSLTSVVTGVGGGFVVEQFRVYVDSTNIYFMHDGYGFNAITTNYSSATIKYYLLQETAD